MRQVPAVQVWPAVQAVPQPPQLVVSVIVSTQVPPQAVWPAGHIIVLRQVPPMQV